MLRTYEFEFQPGVTNVKPGNRTGADERSFGDQIIISSRGAGWVTVRVTSTADHPDAPTEFRIPYAPGTALLDLPLMWPTGGYHVRVDAEPDDNGCKHGVKISLVRSDDVSQPVELAQSVTDAGRLMTFGKAAVPADNTGVVYIKNATESANAFAYAFAAAIGGMTFAGQPKLYPGEALPPIKVRNKLNFICWCDTGLTAKIEVVRAPK